MTKHIIGAIIFSLIVGTSVLIAGLFTEVPSTNSVKVSEHNAYVFKKKKKKRRCRKRRKPRNENFDQLANARVSQALFDLKTNELNTEFLFERKNDSVETVNIALHFFSNDNYGTQHLATEFVSLAPDFNVGNTALKTETSSYRWLKNLQARENLYVIPEVTREPNTYKIYPPIFNPNNATPIILRGKK